MSNQLLRHYQELQRGLEQYFFEIAADCPYETGKKAVYRQAVLGALPDELFGVFLAAGYRRNGNSLYTMQCPDCQACVPIRLVPEKFVANRNQRRVLQRNRDLEIVVGPLMMTEEKMHLCARFLADRYPGRGNTATDYYSGFFLNSITTSMEITYRFEGRLLGVSVVDLGQRWLNAVYFFFDPDFAWRSLGTMNILYLVEICRQYGMEELYLGYWIEGVAAMSYKTRFRPHFLLRDGKWQRGGDSR